MKWIDPVLNRIRRIPRWVASGGRGYQSSAWLFARLHGVIFLVAFLSAWSQADGLLGERGIQPVQQVLDFVEVQLGSSRFYTLPTLFWIDGSDTALHVVLGAGVLFSLALAVGLVPWTACLGAWLCYLSLCSVGGQFFSYQWDALLLESGLLGLWLYHPRCWRPAGRRSFRYQVLGVWLFKILLFKLMFSSGAVKLASGDETWRSLTALTFHYETQPLPIWTAWYVHHLPGWFHKVSVVSMFFIELVLPFFIFLSRPFRLTAAAGFVLLQVLILATGNYCFFNVLTLALCLFLIDDKTWRTRPSPVSDPADSSGRLPLLPAAWTVYYTVLCLLLTLSACGVLRTWPAGLAGLRKPMVPLRSLNGYGLFAVMTTQRPEIIIEGSDDQQTWLPYEFKWKPGRLDRAPALVAPHQPRLDWQMWFASLSADQPQPWRYQPWMIPFIQKLLEGEEDVLRLLDYNPFPGRPPRFIRAGVFTYTFTRPEERAKSGKWWKREYVKPYVPVISLTEPPKA